MVMQGTPEAPESFYPYPPELEWWQIPQANFYGPQPAPQGERDITASQSLAPGFISEYGPASVLTNDEWLAYLASTGVDTYGVNEFFIEGYLQNPEEIEWLEGSIYNRYNASLGELSAAWELSHPGEGDFYSYIAKHFPGGIIPDDVIGKWGLPVSPSVGQQEQLAAMEWANNVYNSPERQALIEAGQLDYVDVSQLDPTYILEQYRNAQVAPYQAPAQGPPAPWFLQELTGLRAGQPIQPMPTKLASGQYLSRLTPSEMQGLGGYINWSAGQVSGAPASYEDWLYQSQQLLPNRVPRGISKWSPSPYWG